MPSLLSNDASSLGVKPSALKETIGAYFPPFSRYILIPSVREIPFIKRLQSVSSCFLIFSIPLEFTKSIPFPRACIPITFTVPDSRESGINEGCSKTIESEPVPPSIRGESLYFPSDIRRPVPEGP